MSSNFVETFIGALVIAVAGLFLYYAYSHAEMSRVSGYPVTANLDSATGIAPGTDVRISGVKIGTVTKTTLDPKTYRAVVSMESKPEVKLPSDSSLKVTAEGLLGGEFLSIEPGGSDDMIKPGGEIQFSQGYIDLVGLVMKTMFGTGGSGQKPEGTPQK